jgi:type IV secretory pathway VirB10-like protein
VSTQPPIPSPARPVRPAVRTPLAFLALAGTCVVAAGVGGYVAQSYKTAELPAVEARPAQPARPASAAPIEQSAQPAPAAAIETPATSAPEPSVSPTVPVESTASVASRTTPAPESPAPRSPVPVEKPAKPRKPADTGAVRTARAEVPATAPQARPAAPSRTAEPPLPVEAPTPEPPAVAEAPAPPPVEPAARTSAKVTLAETFTIPADSVLGLELESTVSSETAQLEDRVDARVTRDVKVDGTTVIPAGSRVRGAVTRVENGGRFKDRGRIEIRFHTLVLADGDTQSITTDALFREGENVGRKSSARIGASAAGGAIIGAIFGGEKGAAIGAAAGAGAGSAVTATQKPSEARFRAGSVVTVRLTAPISITVQQ